MGFDAGFGRVLPRGQSVIGGGWRGQGNHAGLDIAVPVGTPVFAAASGVVSRASASPAGDLGIFAAIQHGNGLVSRYLHFSQLLVAPGQRVSKGQQIGLSGNTGNSAAPHLHFDLKVPSQAVVEAITRVTGTPKTGLEANVTGFGIGVPAEPWVPGDSYSPAVIANARGNGIPLYDQVPHGGSILIKIGLVALIGIAAYKLLVSPSSPAGESPS
jgi:murein DD-endopeptidase MepM/ murein hydrolase activator NlpD